MSLKHRKKNISEGVGGIRTKLNPLAPSFNVSAENNAYRLTPLARNNISADTEKENEDSPVSQRSQRKKK